MQPPPVSIHALLAECDHKRVHRSLYHLSFNPRTPCGVRLKVSKGRFNVPGFQSTHSLRSATNVDNATTWTLYVSIHALLAECDKWAFGLVSAVCCFNPRTPCGVRPRWQIWTWCTCGFQSTHSLRSATASHAQFFPLPVVSIHALLAECDQGLRGRAKRPMVSIHALLAECDTHIIIFLKENKSFNPRTPCGVRHGSISEKNVHGWFQSTHSLRSATNAKYTCSSYGDVSIHALLAECDFP